MLRFWRHALIATVLIAAAGPAAAQGSLLPQPSTPSPDGGDPRSRSREAPDYRKYEYGKELYDVKFGCKTCPLGAQVLDAGVARKLLEDFEARQDLTDKEDEALVTYLRQRFNIFY